MARRLLAGALALGALGGAASRAAATPEMETYSLLEAFHGHTCAGSLFGARLGHAAMAALNSDGKIKGEYFDLSCPVDGIQVSTGLTVGNKSLLIADRDEHRLVLTEQGSGKRIEARLTDAAMVRGKEYRQLSGVLRALPADSPERESKKQEIESVLDWLRTVPDSAVVVVEAIE